MKQEDVLMAMNFASFGKKNPKVVRDEVDFIEIDRLSEEFKDTEDGNYVKDSDEVLLTFHFTFISP